MSSKPQGGVASIELPEHVSPLTVLDKGDLDQLHQATLTVLRETGVKFPSRNALEIFADHGAEVDFSDQIVKLPPDLVEEALEQAPRNYTLGSRGGPELDLTLGEGKTYFATDGCGSDTIDFENWDRRASEKGDVEKTARISDYLDAISFYWPMVSAQDQPSSTVPLHELDAAYANTEKHVQTETVMGEKPAQYAIEIASVIAGGREKLKERPPLSSLICTIDPLAQDKDGIEAGLAYAEAEVPVGFMAMPTMGSTGPAHVPGSIVVGNSEVLSALTLMQLDNPGAPVFYS
ncbi:MAG: trimethylamine methyltransferase family protein, partial [Candidatus Bipolaricaulia bacterium]